MAEIVKLPKMSDTMSEGVIVKWNYKLGDTVKSGDILAEVETDKATMDMEVYAKGTILHLVAEGSTVAVDAVIAVVGAAGEDFAALLTATSAPVATTPVQTAPPSPIETTKTTAPSAAVVETIPLPAQTNNADTINTNGRIVASPLARKLANEKGIDILAVAGTGENGRIVKRDIETFTPAAKSNSIGAFGVESFDELPVSQMRKTIANRLAESKFTAPHFYLTRSINMDKVIAARESMNQSGEVKISMNDLVIKATSIALKKHPMVNSSWLGNVIRVNHHIHIGVAMAVEDGLLVPVVKHADLKSLSLISSEVKEFGKKAKEKKLQPKDWAGNTFTISNLGMFGIDEFTAIINPPDACILAVGGLSDGIKVVNGTITAIKIMKVTLSCDHRVVDGVLGAQFLQTLAGLLEEPVTMLV